MSTIASALQAATERLRATSPTARLDAEILLAHVGDMSRATLLARLSDPLPASAHTRFEQLVTRRHAGEPVAYLTGEREFFGLSLKVDQRVLVPRPETELLVEVALRASARFADRDEIRVADIGVGSGAIAVALAVHLRRARVWAVDLSSAALDVARANAERHGVAQRVIFLQGNGLAPLPGPVDLLVSNPPYTILSEVDDNVRRHEPHLALDGGPDGLDMIRELIDAAPAFLRGGVMLVEIGAWQGAAVAAMARAAFRGGVVTLHQDLAGLDRLVEVVVEQGHTDAA